MPNPFNPFGPANPSQFAGRAIEIEELRRRIRSTISGSPQHSAIMGERGIGKTSLLRKLQEIAHDERCIVARVDLYPGIRDIEYLLLHIHEELRKSSLAYYGPLGKGFEKTRRFLESYSVTIPVVGGGIEKSSERTLETGFKDRLLEVWSKVKEKASAVVIMVDEAETLTHIQGALEYLRNTFSRLGEDGALYCLVISGKSGLFQAVSEVFSPLERFFQPITLMPFTPSEVQELFDKVSAETGISFEDGVKRVIISESEGQPYVVQVYGYCLYEQAAKDQANSVNARTLEVAGPRIYEVLETQLFARRLEEGAGRSKHKLKIVRKLAKSRKDAYSFTEIEKITGMTKKQGLGVYLTQLVEAGCLRKNAAGAYSFFMRIFKKFVLRKATSIDVD